VFERFRISVSKASCTDATVDLARRNAAENAFSMLEGSYNAANLNFVAKQSIPNKQRSQ
jgi:hypothetical protein